VTVVLVVAISVVAVVRVATTSAAITAATTVATRRAALELLILLSNVGQQVLTELLGFLHHLGIRATAQVSRIMLAGKGRYLRDMQEHVLIALPTGGSFHVARAAALDLHTAAGLLLDMLDIGATMTNDLSTEVETRDGLKTNRDLLFRPFALFKVKQWSRKI
jgi:hypothetical protein